MQNCQHCRSERVMSVTAKCNDCFSATWIRNDKIKEHDGYVLSGIGIGGGDYIEFSYCLNCGRIISAAFPLDSPTIK